MDNSVDPVCTDKKHNVRYWDGLDNLSEDYIKTLAESSIPPKKFSEDDLIFFGKCILESAVKMLKDAGCNFPYVDENY